MYVSKTAEGPALTDSPQRTLQAELGRGQVISGKPGLGTPARRTRPKDRPPPQRPRTVPRTRKHVTTPLPSASPVPSPHSHRECSADRLAARTVGPAPIPFRLRAAHDRENLSLAGRPDDSSRSPDADSRRPL